MGEPEEGGIVRIRERITHLEATTKVTSEMLERSLNHIKETAEHSLSNIKDNAVQSQKYAQAAAERAEAVGKEQRANANEWRDALNDMGTNKVDKQLFELLVSDVERLKTTVSDQIAISKGMSETRRENSEGKRESSDKMLAMAAIFIALVSAAVAVVMAFRNVGGS